MIRLFESHHLHPLAGRLASEMERLAPGDPLEAQTVVVPNRDTARWLKLFISEKNDIAANIEFLLPSEWLYKQIRLLYPGLPDQLPSDLLPMSWSVFEILSDESRCRNFTRLYSYLTKQSPARRKTAAWKLAKQIASVFDQYLVYRPEMVLSWQKGRKGSGDEQWQSELWRMLQNIWEQRGGEVFSKKNRAELFDELYRQLKNGKKGPGHPLFVFNPGLVPRPILEVMKATSVRSDLLFFYIWSGGERDESPSAVENLHPLVRIFGREQKYIRRTLDEIFRVPATGLSAESKATGSMLNQVQASISGSTETAGPVDPDETIRIHSCHTPLREIETLHRFLLECFEKDDNLYPDDIAVVTPDPQLYEPYIKAVFNSNENGLPHIPVHIGLPARHSGHTIVRAFRLLMHLLDSRFTFSDVMELFTMKAVCERAGVSEAAAGTVKQWMEDNHVVWGISGEHRKEWGQPDRNHQTWYSALRRGWLGQWMAEEAGLMAGETLLYQRIQSATEKEIWAGFSAFLHNLDKMRKQAVQGKTAEEWGEWLDDWMERFFSHEERHGQPGMEIQNTLKAFVKSAKTAGNRETVPFALVRSEILSALDRQRSAGAMFTRGVTFGSMVPLRSIPFKIIALIGLNEDTFPRKPVTPDFDLMALHPRPGDRNRKLEDRNLFLESIMAAGDIHYCSYIGRSPVDNETIPPSTIVAEWIDFLNAIVKKEKNSLICEEPLHGFSPGNFAAGGDYSKQNYEIARQIVGGGIKPAGLHIDEPLPRSGDDRHIAVEDLVRFFKLPFRGFLKNRFGVSLREPGEEKEEFHIHSLEKHILFQRIFGWTLTGVSFDSMRRMLLESGSLPDGWPGEKIFRELMENIEHAIREIKTKFNYPEIIRDEISIDLHDNRIEGSLISYSKEALLDVTPSGFSGSVAMTTWIRHLCRQVSTGQNKVSYLLCELKKGKPKWCRFRPVANAADALGELVSVYENGQTVPLQFFPKTVYAFEEAEQSEKVDSMAKAANEFEGAYQKYGEREDPSVAVLLGEGAAFTPDFVHEQYRQLVRIMRKHMEVNP